jgi:hypothetical protein
MSRPLAFVIGLALCLLSGWSTADANGRVVMRIGKSAAAAKAVDELTKGTAVAAKAFKSLKEFKGKRSEHGTVHSGQDTFAYTVKGWKLTPHKPVQFNLPFRGNFELSEINLKMPSVLAGGSACSQVESCVELVRRICALAASAKCGLVDNPKKVEIGD